MKHTSIHLGYEVGTGSPVEIPLQHTAVTGQTQNSGKTTTLEALVTRSTSPALAFITKRGESSFACGNRTLPYFRDRADWQFVDQLLEAQLREKNRFLRPWIIKLCRNTKTLADVQRAVRDGMGKAKGISEGVYTQLDAYLDLIVPEIGRAKLAGAISLQPGLNVMDLSAYSTPMQMLFVQSAIDWVNAREKNVTVIVPEAWEFIPEGKGSPVKASAISLVRKGAGLGNFIWVDSQDMAGVDKTILRGCAVWLIGVQREANEIKRNLSNIPANIRRPKPADVAGLSRGQFFACWDKYTIKVYVQPAWMGGDVARRVAVGELIGELPAAKRACPVTYPHLPHDGCDGEPNAYQPTKPETKPQSIDEDESAMNPAQEQMLKEVHSMLRDKRVMPDPPTKPSTAAPHAPPVDEEALYQRFRQRLLKDLPLGGGGSVTLEVIAPEKLRKDFQNEEASRIEIAVRGLNKLQKRVLKLIETTADNEYTSQRTIAERLGRATGGGSWIDLTSAIKDMASAGFVEVKERTGVRKTLREKIAKDLEFYQASDGDVEQVYQAAVYHLATEGEQAGE